MEDVYGRKVQAGGAPKPVAMASDLYERAERRSKLRLEGPFAALVRGTDAGGANFEAEAVVANLSADGVYLRGVRRLAAGAALFIVTRLSRPGGTEAQAPRVALRAAVLRAETQPDGSFGVAAAIIHHRFLDP